MTSTVSFDEIQTPTSHHHTQTHQTTNTHEQRRLVIVGVFSSEDRKREETETAPSSSIKKHIQKTEEQGARDRKTGGVVR